VLHQAHSPAPSEQRLEPVVLCSHTPGTGGGPRAFSKTSKHGEPTNALTAIVTGAAALLVIVYLTVTISAVNEFFYIGTTGVLMVIVVYAVASFGAFRFLLFSGVNRAPVGRWLFRS
jgi:amino acid transporter